MVDKGVEMPPLWPRYSLPSGSVGAGPHIPLTAAWSLALTERRSGLCQPPAVRYVSGAAQGVWAG